MKVKQLPAPAMAAFQRGARRMPPAVTATRSWYKVRNTAGAPVTEIYLFDEVGAWGVTAESFVDQLRAVKTSAVDVHINSPGGEVWDGLAIFNALKDHKATVTTYVDGLAASAASFIAQAGDRRIVARASQVMIHDALGVCLGNAADMAKMVEQLDRCSNQIADLYAARAGGTRGQWRDRMRAETWYMGREAVGAGLADAVSDPSPDDEAWDRLVAPLRNDPALAALRNTDDALAALRGSLR